MRAGINGDGTYWHVTHIVDPSGLANSDMRFYFGYIHEDDVDWSKTEADEQSGDAKD